MSNEKRPFKTLFYTCMIAAKKENYVNNSDKFMLYV